MVFVETLDKDGTLSDLELSIYSNWFELMLQDREKELIPDGFIYLRAEPRTCASERPRTLRTRCPEP